jgi:hypothetical protein
MKKFFGSLVGKSSSKGRDEQKKIQENPSNCAVADIRSDSLQGLNADLWIELFFYLGALDFLQCRRICKAIKKTLDSPQLWQRLCNLHFPVTKSIETLDWKKAFLDNYLSFSGTYGFVNQDDEGCSNTRINIHQLTLLQNRKNPLEGTFIQVADNQTHKASCGRTSFQIMSGKFKVTQLLSVFPRWLPKTLEISDLKFFSDENSYGMDREKEKKEILPTLVLSNQLQFFLWKSKNGIENIATEFKYQQEQEFEGMSSRSTNLFVCPKMSHLPVKEQTGTSSKLLDWGSINELVPSDYKYLLAPENERVLASFLSWFGWSMQSRQPSDIFNWSGLNSERFKEKYKIFLRNDECYLEDVWDFHLDTSKLRSNLEKYVDKRMKIFKAAPPRTIKIKEKATESKGKGTVFQIEPRQFRYYKLCTECSCMWETSFIVVDNRSYGRVFYTIPALADISARNRRGH